MKNIVIIREGRIFLQESVEQEKRLSLKICVGTNIYKYANNLVWSQPCNRWETTQEIKLQNPNGFPLELELFYPARKIPKVVGQASLDLAIFRDRLEEEIKIALTFDGMIKGWLYCQIQMEGLNQKEKQVKFLCIHKISFFFLEEHSDELKIQIFQNMHSVYQKTFFLSQKTKTVFPNIKNSIKYSDVIHLSVLTHTQQFKTISFIIDNIKRGKTAYYQTWIRNRYNNKAGDIKVQYFLQNLFLQNERKVYSRKAVFPKTLSRMSTLITEGQKKSDTIQKTKAKLEQISQIESSRIVQRETNLVQKILNIKRKCTKNICKRESGSMKKEWNQNRTPSLKRTATKLTNHVSSKSTANFYFQNPLE